MSDSFIEAFSSESEAGIFNNILLSSCNDFLTIYRIGLHHLVDMQFSKKLNLHSHSFYELHFSLKGTAEYILEDGNKITLHENEWLIFPPDYKHKIIGVDSDYIKFSCAFYKNDNMTDERLTEIFDNISLKSDAITKRQLKNIEMIYLEKKNMSINSALIIHNYASNVILDVLNCFYKIAEEKLKNENPGKSNDERYAIAIQYIKDNIYNPITCEDVAKIVYLSSKQLTRIFRKRAAMSVAEYITQHKCEEAKNLLISSSAPLRDISDSLGFRDEYYFNRFFKKHTGTTPHQYRLKMRRKV